MQSTAPVRPLSGSPQRLAAAFATVPDPRRAGSVISPLPAILALAVTAMLANHLSVLAMAEWGARQDPAVLTTRGFAGGRTPCQSTLRRLVRQLDGHALAATLTQCLAPSAAPTMAEPGRQGGAIDGKAQRGRPRCVPRTCPGHALSAVCHEHGVVLAHEPIERGADKTEAELPVAPDLIARIAWHGRVLTGDALFCHRILCRQVVEGGGDYLLVVKEHQPTLLDDIHLLFDPPPALATRPLQDRRAVQTIDRGHGRHDEVRQLVASTALTAYLDWPGLAQVFRLERTWRERGSTKRMVHYGITRLPPEAGSPARLMALRRGQWAIENRLHRRKDVTCGEDASLIHVGQGPTVVALLRDAAISLLHRRGIRRVAACLRTHSPHPEAAIALAIEPLPGDA